MWIRIKQYLLIAAGIAVLYFFLDNHVIFDQNPNNWFDTDIYLLKKSSLHLHYTFVSLGSKKPENIIKIDQLREDGIGDLLVELGKLTEEEKSRLEKKYDNQ